MAKLHVEILTDATILMSSAYSHAFSVSGGTLFHLELLQLEQALQLEIRRRYVSI